MAGAERDTSQIEPFSLYLREIGEIPILSPEKQRELVVQFKESESARERLINNNGELSSGEKEELEMVIEKGEEAWKTLIISNLRLVSSVAKEFQGRGLDFPDLVSEGNFGLVKAIDGFDLKKTSSKGEPIRFSTYAVYWIRQTIGRAIVDQSRLIRLPVHVAEEIYRMKRVIGHLTKKLEREPTAKEIGAELSLTEEEVLTRLQQAEPIVSLNIPLGEEDGIRIEIEDFIEDEDVASPGETAEFNALLEIVNDWLKSLSPRERKVIEMRFGLKDGDEMTLEEVGEELGVTRERIRQLQKKAINKLRYQATLAKRKDMFLRGIKW